jgi:hypothetical protein
MDGEPEDLWWCGESKSLNRLVFTHENPEDVAFYLGAILFAKRQDQSLLGKNNLGAGKHSNAMKSDFLDFGSLAGAVILKALTGSCLSYLDDWSWDFHRKLAAESKTRTRARSVLEQLIYLDVMNDILKGLNANGLHA